MRVSVRRVADTRGRAFESLTPDRARRPRRTTSARALHRVFSVRAQPRSQNGCRGGMLIRESPRGVLPTRCARPMSTRTTKARPHADSRRGGVGDAGGETTDERRRVLSTE